LSEQVDVFNRACRDLPEGWELYVCLESGAGWIEIYNNEGSIVDFDDDHEQTMEQRIDFAVATANKLHSGIEP
jgi:hypothetical protein